MEKPFLEESFLITKQDHINMSIDYRRYITPKENIIILRVLGIIAVCIGAAAFINIKGGVYQSICWIVLIVIGFYTLSYYDVISPSITRKQAAHFYDVYKGSIHSKTVRFFDNRVELTSEERKLRIPKKYLYKIYVSKDTVMIFTDISEFLFIPKRVLSESQLTFIEGYSEK